MVVWCKYCELPVTNQSSLQCQKCDNFIHLSCLQSEKPSRFEGDFLFDLDCKNCEGEDSEKIKRSKLTWLQIIHLALYNLSIRESGRQGFFRWKDDICRFISQNWNYLFPDKPMTNNWRSTVAGTLSVYCSTLFKSGQSLFNETGWWALNEVKPPPKVYSDDIRGKLKSRSRETTQQSNGIVGEGVGNMGRGKRKQRIDGDRIDIKQSKMDERETTTTDANSLQYAFLGMDSITEDFNDTEVSAILHEDVEDLIPNDDPFSLIKVEDIGKSLSQSLLISDKGNHTPSEAWSEISVKSELVSNDSANEDSLSISQEQFKARSKSQKNTTLNEPRLIPMNTTQEREFLNKLKCYPKALAEDPAAKRLQRKLKLRKLKLEIGLPVFDLDRTVQEMIRSSAPQGVKIMYTDTLGRELPMPENEEKSKFTAKGRSLHHPALQGVNVLDKFHITVPPKQKDNAQQANQTFLSRLVGRNEELNARSVGSPYTQRVLKPYIRRDYNTKPLKLSLMNELLAYTHRFDQHWIRPCPSPIDYCYVQPHHIPAVNAMCEEFFWNGIDLSECLQYPDFSCVVLYRKLVIGCAFMVPDVKYNEAYISFILVHPDWRKAGIGTFMIYHLIQTCMGKDVTLHVSAANSTMMLYQKFGFKAEEFILDFYDKYLPDDSTECRHAFFLRLQR
eukprot:Seg49.2 transcript_id=Seg49.2/GoldUCD/mRNA.D3Y31 product="Cysteine-rich protein 2-binding protein" protein_id=Seg49.2/GoldUCD/D3Y31